MLLVAKKIRSSNVVASNMNRVSGESTSDLQHIYHANVVVTKRLGEKNTGVKRV